MNAPGILKALYMWFYPQLLKECGIIHNHRVHCPCQHNRPALGKLLRRISSADVRSRLTLQHNDNSLYDSVLQNLYLILFQKPYENNT